MITETITLAGGCFWCTEAIFQRLKGVITVTPGYSGGEKENPTYEEISSGNTNHTESIQIEFDPNVISLEQLLEIFFKLHDPTTLNKQEADIGTQYRSAVFYTDDKQRDIAEKMKMDMQKLYPKPIVTEITPFTNFFKAEDYHMNYYNTHKNQSYCQIVIDPKIQKLYKEFKAQVKE